MKMKLLTAIASAAMLCTLSTAVLAQNVAIVNGKAVPKSRLDALSQQLARTGRQVPAEDLKNAVIAREVFAQEAQKLGLDASDEYKEQIEQARQAILINELLTRYQKANPVSDEEAKAAYDKFAAANSGKEYKAHHILVEKEDDAKAIIAKLKKGGKFDEIAKKSSKDTGSGAKGGELDWAGAGSYVPEFSEALTKLTKGKTTETPVKTQFGYHIIRLDDVRDQQLPKFEDVKPQVAQQVLQEKVNKYQEELRAKAKVE